MQPADLRLAAVVRLEIIHTIRGDRHEGAVAARQQLLLEEIPDGELEMLTRAAGHFFEIREKDAGLVRLDAALRVEHFEHGDPYALLRFDIGLGLRAAR